MLKTTYPHYKNDTRPKYFLNRIRPQSIVFKSLLLLRLTDAARVFDGVDDNTDSLVNGSDDEKDETPVCGVDDVNPCSVLVEGVRLVQDVGYYPYN